MKRLLVLAIFFIVLFMAPMSFASYFLQPTIPAGNVVINKLVRNPQSGQLVDNLFDMDPHFLPDQEVVFRIDVRNNTQTELQNVMMTDRLPDELNFVAGPGNFDLATRTLTFVIDKIGSQETKSFEIKARVRLSNELPQLPLNCNVKNLAQVIIGKIPSQDTSLLCVESKVLGVVTELPRTGPSGGTLAFAMFLLFGISSATFYYLSNEK